MGYPYLKLKSMPHTHKNRPSMTLIIIEGLFFQTIFYDEINDWDYKL